MVFRAQRETPLRHLHNRYLVQMRQDFVALILPGHSFAEQN
jgi:hypothetical protein